MGNPWDIPYSAPLRPGEKNVDALYLSVGRALTMWEGLEAELGALYATLTIGPNERYLAPALRAFGTITNTHSRAEMIAHAAEAFFYLAPASDKGESLETELREILKNYRGWAGRRNDIAHGYATPSQHPDYYDDEQPIITTYSLCPSHGHSRKWDLRTEPVYHYIASEIDAYAAAFEKLADPVTNFAVQIDEWRESWPPDDNSGQGANPKCLSTH